MCYKYLISSELKLLEFRDNDKRMKKSNYINVILQARSNSNRLPFKSLMPINKIPLVVLCAKRLI